MTHHPHRLAACVALAFALSLTGVRGQDTTPRRGFSIEIVEPLDQDVVLGKTKIVAKVEVTRPELVDRVEFLIGDEVIFVDRESPYECYHDFGEEPRALVVRAVAHHRDQVTVSDAVVTRNVFFGGVERVNRILLWISGTDKNGDFVSEIDRSKLQIFEDGAPQSILEFYREDRPITLAILLDTSGSMVDKLDHVHSAASAFVESLRPADQALVIDFDDKVFLIQDLTSDHAALKEAITSTEPKGATSLYDALHAAYRRIGKIEGRKAIVLLSDGEDTSSQFGHKRVLEEAMANSSLIYAIALGGASGGPRKGVLKEFAEQTGGGFYVADKVEELAQIYARIAEELRMQYFVTYSTANEVWDGRWIKVRVESLDDDIKIRARRGFFAVRRGSPP